VSETTRGTASSALDQSSIIVVDAQPGEARTHRVGPTAMRWTHIALPCTDIDTTIDWYTRFTPLELLDRREDADGQGAWLGHPDQGDKPFILVLVSFFRDQDKGPQPVMAPFAHIGMEVASKEEVEEIARRGEAEGCLAWPPTMMPPPIGYICALKDPDGNMIEFSYDQGVYAKAQEVWGTDS
jgi:catechol 2,3-dioxygenase-like lactoylglutathione lyase family enzyme